MEQRNAGSKGSTSEKKREVWWAGELGMSQKELVGLELSLEGWVGLDR